MSVTIRLDLGKLKDIQRNLPQLVERRVAALAIDGEAYIKLSFGAGVSSPGMPPGVDTGKLRNSIRAESLGGMNWMIATDAEYGPHLEYGTSKMAARPFMSPALDYMARTAGERFAGVLERSL